MAARPLGWGISDSLPDTFVMREKQTEKPEGDRKGPHPSQLHSRLYYDHEAASQARS
jgi:hypothetical protein